jgi:hypothetical protein
MYPHPPLSQLNHLLQKRTTEVVLEEEIQVLKELLMIM